MQAPENLNDVPRPGMSLVVATITAGLVIWPAMSPTSAAGASTEILTRFEGSPISAPKPAPGSMLVGGPEL